MFENMVKFLKKFNKKEKNTANNSKDAAKERLHLVLMQDRANVSADFLELMKQEIIEVIKKYIEVDENAIDVRLTNKENEDGTNGAPALYANIPILNIKNEARKVEAKEKKKENKDIENNKKEEQHIENKQEEKKKAENKNNSNKEKSTSDTKTSKDIKDDKNIKKQEEVNESEKNNTKTENNKKENDKNKSIEVNKVNKKEKIKTEE